VEIDNMPVFANPDDAPSELQRLLLTAVPVNAHGYKSILHLSKLLGVSRWSIQKWIMNEKIPPHRAVDVVDISEGRVSLADFSRFIYKP
jgi:hypothetical protein